MEKQVEKEQEEETQREMSNQPQRTTMSPLSLPTRRHGHSQMNLPRIRREALLQDFFLHGRRTRNQNVDRLFAVHLEPLVRRAVREELHPLLHCFNVPQRLLPEQNTQARYQLHFTNSVKDTIFTDDPVTDKKGDPIEAAIYDSCTQSIISPDCFLSSAKVRITVLDAEFWKNKPERFTTDEFSRSILKERDGKGPILTASQKPDMLKLEDKIQSLKNIGKDRASLLEKKNIKTVEDFLHWYHHKQHELRMILGIKSKSDKGWKTMVEHAMECENEFQAKHKVLDNANHPPQVPVGQHVNIANASMYQLNVDQLVNSNINPVSHMEVVHGRTLYQGQFCFSSEEIHMLGQNVHMLPNPGLRFEGSGSSEPNPHEHNLIGSGFAEAEIYSESVPIGVSFPNAEITPYDIGHATPLQQAPGQPQLNPCENNTNDQGDMSAIFGELDQILCFSPFNDMAIESGNTMNADYMHNMNGDGLLPLELIQMEQEFSYILQPSSSPYRKAKRKALLKWIISPAIARKRARAAPPVTQTTLLAM